MKINKSLLLHVTMAFAAVFVLAVPPLLDAMHPPLQFRPLIETMETTYKEQNEAQATISYALQGHAIFFLGASEVSTSEDKPYAVFNYFNKTLRRPVVAYGNIMIENLAQYSILSYYKDQLSDKTKLVLLVSPDSFFFDSMPPVVFANHIPGRVFDKLSGDETIGPQLKHYLTGIKSEDVSHLSFNAMRVRGWHWSEIKKELDYQLGSYCDLIRHYYTSLFFGEKTPPQPWPVEDKTAAAPDWDSLVIKAKNLNAINHENAQSHWMDPEYYHDHPKPEVWDAVPPTPEQVLAFTSMMKMLHERHVQVAVIIDPLNPWANDHPERFKPANDIIKSTLNGYHIPYLDMYDQPYQNGWNWDFIHPTDFGWVTMDKFIAESFK